MSTHRVLLLQRIRKQASVFCLQSKASCLTRKSQRRKLIFVCPCQRPNHCLCRLPLLIHQVEDHIDGKSHHSCPWTSKKCKRLHEQPGIQPSVSTPACCARLVVCCKWPNASPHADSAANRPLGKATPQHMSWMLWFTSKPSVAQVVGDAKR